MTDDVLLITVSAYVGTGTWVLLTIDELLELIHFVLQWETYIVASCH